jgi:hypothetical protein
MCIVVYIASDFPLPLVQWNDEQPEFHVTELTIGENDGKVRSHMASILDTKKMLKRIVNLFFGYRNI